MKNTIKSKREINVVFDCGCRIQTGSTLAVVRESIPAKDFGIHKSNTKRQMTPNLAGSGANRWELSAKATTQKAELPETKVIKAAKEEHCPSGRIAIIAGKRLGNAPQRNRAKRLLRVAAQKNGAPWVGFDVILIAKTSLLKGGLSVVQADVNRIAKQLIAAAETADKADRCRADARRQKNTRENQA